jgi:hypothetical protein
LDVLEPGVAGVFNVYDKGRLAVRNALRGDALRQNRNQDKQDRNARKEAPEVGQSSSK